MGFGDMLSGGLQSAQGYIAGLELARQHQMQQLQLQNTEEDMEQQRRLRPLQVDQASANVGLTQGQTASVGANTAYTTQRTEQDREKFPVELDMLHSQKDMYRSQADKNELDVSEAKDTSAGRVARAKAQDRLGTETALAAITNELPWLMSDAQRGQYENAILTNSLMQTIIPDLVNAQYITAKANANVAQRESDKADGMAIVYTPDETGVSPAARLFMASQQANINATNAGTAHQELVTQYYPQHIQAIINSVRQHGGDPAQALDKIGQFWQQPIDIQTKIIDNLSQAAGDIQAEIDSNESKLTQMRVEGKENSYDYRILSNRNTQLSGQVTEINQTGAALAMGSGRRFFVPQAGEGQSSTPQAAQAAINAASRVAQQAFYGWTGVSKQGRVAVTNAISGAGVTDPGVVASVLKGSAVWESLSKEDQRALLRKRPAQNNVGHGSTYNTLKSMGAPEY